MSFTTVQPYKPTPYIPKKLTIQWHITNACNNCCKHCYQTDFSSLNNTSWTDLNLIFRQILELIVEWKKLQPHFTAHINLTGGEPMLHKHFFDLLELFHAQKSIVSYAVLSNGSLINNQSVKHLSALKPSFVQVSIEGDRKMNDAIRGTGSFKSTCEAIDMLKKHQIRTFISFTASKQNVTEFEKVVHIAIKHKADQLWADRLLPLGNATEWQLMCLNETETKAFFDKMYELKQKLQQTKNNVTQIVMNRALQFLCGGDHIYSCNAAKGLIAIMPNADVYPCRRMSIVCGNLLQTNIKEIYYNNQIFNQLREETVIDGCSNCFFAKTCNGGLKCLSYSLTNNFTSKDKGCWRKNNLII